MIDSKNDASRNLEKALQALEQAKQRVANEKKKQNEKKRKAEGKPSPPPTTHSPPCQYMRREWAVLGLPFINICTLTE